MSQNQCPRAQTPSHGCPTTRPRSNYSGDVRKFKKKVEASGKRGENGRKKTQTARHQPVEHTRVHGGKKGAFSDVVDAVTKFEAIRPSRSCTRCRRTCPPRLFGRPRRLGQKAERHPNSQHSSLSSLLTTVACIECMKGEAGH